MIRPYRYTDLRDGLPGIATNLLADRLRGLQAAGVVTAEAAPPPVATTLYSLTEWGAGLRPILIDLGRWGAQQLMADGQGDDHFRSRWAGIGVEAIYRDVDLTGVEPITLLIDAGGEPALLAITPRGITADPASAPAARATRSMPWPSPVPRCARPTCRTVVSSEAFTSFDNHVWQDCPSRLAAQLALGDVVLLGEQAGRRDALTARHFFDGGAVPGESWLGVGAPRRGGDRREPAASGRRGAARWRPCGPRSGRPEPSSSPRRSQGHHLNQLRGLLLAALTSSRSDGAPASCPREDPAGLRRRDAGCGPGRGPGVLRRRADARRGSARRRRAGRGPRRGRRRARRNTGRGSRRRLICAAGLRAIAGVTGPARSTTSLPESRAARGAAGGRPAQPRHAGDLSAPPARRGRRPRPPRLDPELVVPESRRGAGLPTRSPPPGYPDLFAEAVGTRRTIRGHRPDRNEDCFAAHAGTAPIREALDRVRCRRVGSPNRSWSPRADRRPHQERGAASAQHGHPTAFTERTLDRPGTQQRLADALGDPRRVETAAAEGLDLQPPAQPIDARSWPRCARGSRRWPTVGIR